MDIELINPFVSSTVNVLRTMAQTELKVGKIGPKADRRTSGQVTGLIGMASEAITGNLILSFDKASIIGIVSRMLMESHDDINDQVLDAVGEITNMICGGAKAELSQKGLSFNMATPMMIKGENVEIAQLTEGPLMQIPFQTQDGWFVVETNLSRKPG
jgi:chemotaxis protein CheX